MAPAQIETVAAALLRIATGDWADRRRVMLAAVPQPHLRRLVNDLTTVWEQQATDASAECVAYALLAASRALAAERRRETVELIWTGPESMSVPLRRTDQALLDVIDAAERSLLLVSYAVYMVPAVSTAVVQAAQRGTQVRICVETQDAGNGQIVYDTVAALGKEILQVASVYAWPREKRPTGSSGKPGALHVKCAVADRRMLFLSSANLTGHALNLNMELGVLIRGGTLPGQVADHFQRMIEDTILVRLS